MSTTFQVIYWRNIPAQIIVKKGRQTVKDHLGLRFEEAIDMAAMRLGFAGSNDYLEQWKRGEPQPIDEEDAEVALAKLLAQFREEYNDKRLKELVLACIPEVKEG